MSSSNREVPACDGILFRGDKPIGPMRMPAHRTSDFVSQFNRTYRRVGLSITPVSPPSAQKKSPASDDTGDDFSS